MEQLSENLINNLIGIARTNIGLSSMVGGTDNGNCTFIYDVNHSTGSTFIGDVVGGE